MRRMLCNFPGSNRERDRSTMSLYDFLEIPVPTIAYCVFHQAHPDVPEDQYLKTMQDLHQALAAVSGEISSGYAKSLTDLIARESQILQNGLAHFLQTPISSDNDEVRGTLAETFGRFTGQLLPATVWGAYASSEGRVFFVSSKKSTEKKLLRNGKTYLDRLGLVTAKGHPDIFESTFTVAGGQNLDVLEHIVRDRLGIYATPHGDHLREFKGHSFSAYNLIAAYGEDPGRGRELIELAFFFSKPDMPYAPFRNGLSRALETLSSSLRQGTVTLWQRKLGLGGGCEFILRLATEESGAAGEVIAWLNGYEDDRFVSESIIGKGHLVLKELLPTS